MKREDEGSGRRETGIEEIVKRFRDGDPATTELVRVRVRRILGFRGFGIPLEDRLDLEQNAMTQLWSAVGRAKFERAGFWGLVEVVCARRCIDWRRARRDERALEEVAEPVSSRPDSLARVLGRERVDRARQILAELPEPCRELIRLQATEGKTYREIATILNTSEGALRVQMHRCVERARRRLRETDQERE